MEWSVTNDLGDLTGETSADARQILSILFDEFEGALAAATQPWKKRGRILIVAECTGCGADAPGSDEAMNLLIVASVAVFDGPIPEIFARRM
jgi:hypothetical protein